MKSIERKWLKISSKLLRMQIHNKYAVQRTAIIKKVPMLIEPKKKYLVEMNKS